MRARVLDMAVGTRLWHRSANDAFVHRRFPSTPVDSQHVAVRQLSRMTQFKEKGARRVRQLWAVYYPVLMAADILLYKATRAGRRSDPAIERPADRPPLVVTASRLPSRRRSIARRCASWPRRKQMSNRSVIRDLR
jgi:hypothetical protein